MQHLSLDPDYSAEITAELGKLLADFQIFYLKLQNYHWNVKGTDFFSLHVKFEEIYTRQFESIDELAEKISALGGIVPGTMAEYADLKSLTEGSATNTAKEMVADLVSDIEHTISKLRQLIDQFSAREEHAAEGVIDMLVGFLKDLQQDHWMLSAYLN